MIYFVFYLFYVYRINGLRQLSDSYVHNERKRKLLTRPQDEMSLYFNILNTDHHPIGFEVKPNTTNNDLYEIISSSPLIKNHRCDPKIILSSHGRELPIDV